MFANFRLKPCFESDACAVTGRCVEVGRGAVHFLPQEKEERKHQRGEECLFVSVIQVPIRWTTTVPMPVQRGSKCHLATIPGSMDNLSTYQARAAELKQRPKGTFSERRRIALLKSQRESRQKHKAEKRKLASMALANSSDTGAGTKVAASDTDSSVKSRRSHAASMQLPDWLLDVPQDLGGHISDVLGAAAVAAGSSLQPYDQADEHDADEDDGGGWLLTPRPEGKACLVVVGGGRAVLRDRSGVTLLTLRCPLPGGGLGLEAVLDSGTAAGSTFVAAGSRGKQRPYCVFDGVLDVARGHLHLVDVAAWAGQEVHTLPAAVRLQWLVSKWHDDVQCHLSSTGTHPHGVCLGPVGDMQLPLGCVRFTNPSLAKQLAELQQLRVSPLNWHNLTSSSLSTVYGDSVAKGGADGLLFMHAGAARHTGVSPLLLRWRDARCSKWDLKPGSPFEVVLEEKSGGVLYTRDGTPVMAMPSAVARDHPLALVRVRVTASDPHALFEACEADAAAVHARLLQVAQTAGGTDGLLLAAESVEPASSRHVQPDSSSKLLFFASRQCGEGVSYEHLQAAAAANEAAANEMSLLTASLSIEPQSKTAEASPTSNVMATTVPLPAPVASPRRRGGKGRRPLSMAALAAAVARGDVSCPG